MEFGSPNMQIFLSKPENYFSITILIQINISTQIIPLIFRIYTIELYPWVLKEKAFGLCKALASFASIFSPLVYYVNEQTKQLSLIM